jgi:hypothetical protein
MFYVPWNGNDTELARLLECIENNKTTILDGKLPLLVDGYCNSLGSEAENLATAKIRANRVKSELIIRAEIKEENFITRNHATEGDFVTVRLTVPVKETAVMDAEAEARHKAGKLCVIPIPRHVEHVFPWHEAEGVGRVCFLLRNDRKSDCRQPQKQGKKSDFSAHAFIYFTNSNTI